jgi:hypothetical protein
MDTTYTLAQLAREFDLDVVDVVEYLGLADEYYNAERVNDIEVGEWGREALAQQAQINAENL